MSERNRRDDRHEIRDDERRENLLVRRVKAFENRSRKGGDASTWAVVLGALIGVLTLMSYSLGDETRYILVPLIAFIAWWIVVSWKGQVNVTSILWGSDITDGKLPPNEFWIHQPSIVLTLVAFGSLVRNAIAGYTYSWAGLLLLAACVAYAIVYIRVRILRTL